MTSGEIPDPISANVEAAANHGEAMLADYFGQLGALDSFTAFGSAGTLRLEQQRQIIQQRLQGVDGAVARTQEIIRMKGIAEPIDELFVQTVVGNIIDGSADETYEDEQLPQLIEQLAQRNQLAAIEAASQNSATVTISGERNVTVHQGIDTTCFGLELPFINDPREMPIELGPEAVTSILGAPITDDDYEAITELMFSTVEGSAGESLAHYKHAVQVWAADLAATGKEDLHLLALRRQAVSGVIMAMDDSTFSGDIILDSIFTTEVRKFESLSYIQTPQPYTH